MKESGVLLTCESSVLESTMDVLKHGTDCLQMYLNNLPTEIERGDVV